jgi:23S rRNA pseudouridine1911/1915/1917 synthase
VSSLGPAEGDALELTVAPEAAGSRLDAYLAAAVRDLSRSRAQRSIDDGDVLVNGSLAKPSLKLKAGDRVEIELPGPLATTLVPEPIDIDVVYEDDEIVVVNKPAGLVVHPGAGIASGTLANGLLYRFGSAGGPPWRPGIVHRLDKDTSGLLVVARTGAGHAALSAQFQERTVTKRYLALVYGRLAASEGRLDKPIGRHPTARVRMAVRPPGQGRPALTLYRVLERFDDATSLEVEIRTGRTHQIRVHLADAGHAIVGDESYGKGRAHELRESGLRRRIETLGRHFLHAALLAFDHPRTGRRLEFSSPLPDPLAELGEFLRARAR